MLNMFDRLFKRRPKTTEHQRAWTVWVGLSVIERTVEVLQESGTSEERHEGVAYWAGRRLGADVIVTTCIVPAARTTWGSFQTSSQTNAKVVMYLASAGLELLGQVHSHPGAHVDHSDGDDERALMPYEGFLSIVVPHYARRGMRPLTRCGVHVFENGWFSRLNNHDVEGRIHVVEELADLRNR